MPDPTSERLDWRNRSDRAWQQFVKEGVEPAGVREDILRSWRRSRDSYRIDWASARPSAIITAEALRERRRSDAAFGHVAPALRDFSEQMGLADCHALAYFDSDGWLLDIEGARSAIDSLGEIWFSPGTNWAEESAGTNAAGIALVTGRPVEVCASEHFISAWHQWSCAAAPIRAMDRPRPVAVVNVIGPWASWTEQTLLVVKAVARALEERVRAAMGVRDEVMRYAFRAARETGDAVLAIDAQGRVVAANDAASRRRLVEDGAIAVSMREPVLRALRSNSLAPDADIRLDPGEGPSVVVSPLRHEGSPIGAILRVAATPVSARQPRRAYPSARYDFNRILGHSRPLRQAIDLARTAARNDLPVILLGESGTGKELFAQAIHSASARREGPFVAVNCGSIPAQLVEAELFGYESGSFTGARREGNPGRFEDAAGGTLFLDEVSELPLPAQTALLRLLQEKEVVRLGGSAPRPVDVRVLAASNKPLDEEIRSRRFRSDLYYRLNVLSISVPPLRDRGEDVTVLAKVFLSEAEADVGRQQLSLSRDAIDALHAYAWPGNVRELKNVILRAAATSPEPLITARDLFLEAAPLEAPGAVRGASRTLREAVVRSERDALLGALNACAWNFARTANHLGISRMTLYRLLQKCNISRSQASS